MNMWTKTTDVALVYNIIAINLTFLWGKSYLTFWFEQEIGAKRPITGQKKPHFLSSGNCSLDFYMPFFDEHIMVWGLVSVCPSILTYMLTCRTISQVCFHGSFWNLNTLLGLMLGYISILTIFTPASPDG